MGIDLPFDPNITLFGPLTLSLKDLGELDVVPELRFVREVVPA